MALEAEFSAAPSETEWTCRMHPEVIRDAPGQRPICGMALVRRSHSDTTRREIGHRRSAKRPDVRERTLGRRCEHAECRGGG